MLFRSPDFVFSSLPEQMNPYTPIAGRLPTASGEVAVAKEIAERGSIEVGQRAQLATQAGAKDVTVVGILQFGDGTTSLGGSTTVLAPLADVQRWWSLEGKASYIYARSAGPSEEELRDRVRTDMTAEAEEHASRHIRTDLLKQLSQRVSFELPASLIEREMDRRLEQFAQQLMQQQIDPRQAGIDWTQFRDAQREAAREAVASTLVLDELARREKITVSAEDVDKEIERFAERAGRTPAALRAQLEKDGGISRLVAGMRREKAIDLALSRATMTGE